MSHGAMEPRRFGLSGCAMVTPVLLGVGRRLTDAEAADATIAFLRVLHGRMPEGALRAHLALVRDALELDRLARIVDRREAVSADDGRGR